MYEHGLIRITLLGNVCYVYVLLGSICNTIYETAYETSYAILFCSMNK